MSKEAYQAAFHLCRLLMRAIGNGDEKCDQLYAQLFALPRAEMRAAEAAYNWWQDTKDRAPRYWCCTHQYWSALAKRRIRPDYSRYESRIETDK